MNAVDLIIIAVCLFLFILALRKIINNFKCMNKGAGCAGCALSGMCHKEEKGLRVKL